MAFDEVSGMKITDPDAMQIMKDYMANGRFSIGEDVRWTSFAKTFDAVG